MKKFQLVSERSVSPSRNLDSDDDVSACSKNGTRFSISLDDAPVVALKNGSRRKRRAKSKVSDISEVENDEIGSQNSKNQKQKRKRDRPAADVVHLDDTGDTFSNASPHQNQLARINRLLRGSAEGGVHSRTRAKKRGGRDKAHAISID